MMVDSLKRVLAMKKMMVYRDCIVWQEELWESDLARNLYCYFILFCLRPSKVYYFGKQRVEKSKSYDDNHDIKRTPFFGV